MPWGQQKTVPQRIVIFANCPITMDIDLIFWPTQFLHGALCLGPPVAWICLCCGLRYECREGDKQRYS